MSISKNFYGTTNLGEEVFCYTLRNQNGTEVSLINYGAIITSLKVKDSKGKTDDIVLGYDSLEGYVNDCSGFGAFVGRHANRIANASFELNGVKYELDKNEGEHNLHSGFKGYNKFMYEASLEEDEDVLSIEFTRVSPHMEQGFPGNLELSISYSLTKNDELVIEYFAVSDMDTIVNLTNHSYFNLAGHNSGDVLKQKVMIDAEFFTPTDDLLIPTGEIRDVQDTPMDFRIMKSIGDDIFKDYQPLKQGKGYDHNYMLEIQDKSIKKVAQMQDDVSGRCMEVYTNMPALQFYTANMLKEDSYTKDGAKYGTFNGVCFETQFPPNSCNTPNFPSCVLKKGEEYRYVTVYKFLS